MLESGIKPEIEVFDLAIALQRRQPGEKSAREGAATRSVRAGSAQRHAGAAFDLRFSAQRASRRFARSDMSRRGNRPTSMGARTQL